MIIIILPILDIGIYTHCDEMLQLPYDKNRKFVRYESFLKLVYLEKENFNVEINDRNT